MKKFSKFIFMCMAVAIVCAGCGKSYSARTIKNTNSVDAVLQNEIEKSTQEENSFQEENDTQEENSFQEENDTQEEKNFQEENDTQEDLIQQKDTSVDIDLSVMNGDMTYATVYQLMMVPDEYVGQTIKIKGVHYSSYYEPTGLTYHYALIQDALACCAQGLEFELEDGTEYPAEEEEVIVTGTFTTYEENGMLFCTLRNSKVD